jgi:hypothetical protein
MTAADLDLTPIIVIPLALMALKAYSYGLTKFHVFLGGDEIITYLVETAFWGEYCNVSVISCAS